MHTYIAMLRGINVSGQKNVKMEKLKEAFGNAGFRNVQTYIQSGNAVFQCSEKDPAKVAEKAEGVIEKAFGFRAAAIIRSVGELKKAIKDCPFPRQGTSRIYVTFLSTKPEAAPEAEIAKAKADNEQVSLKGKEIYLNFPDGYGKTKLSNTFFEKKLKTTATTRNWNTVMALAEMAKTKE